MEGALMEAVTGQPLAAPVAAHVETCGKCRKVLDGQLRLRAATAALVAESARFTVPQGLESALLRELDSRRRMQRRRFVYGVVGGAIAASLAVVWFLVHRPTPKVPRVEVAAVVSHSVQTVASPVEQRETKHHGRVAKPAAEPEQPFIAIPYTLPLEPYERADVMRMDVPVAALIAAGLPMSMVDPGASARADVLVGQDGRARAVRLISISSSN